MCPYLRERERERESVCVCERERLSDQYQRSAHHWPHTIIDHIPSLTTYYHWPHTIIDHIPWFNIHTMVTSASCQHLLAVIHFTCTTYYIPSLKIHTTYQRIMSACTFHHSLYVYYIPAHDAIIQLAFEAQMKTEDGCRAPEAHVPGAGYVCKCVSVCVCVCLCVCVCVHTWVCV